MRAIDVRSGKRCEMIDISRDVGRCVRESGIKNGIVYVFVPHTTAGITINENADADVRLDLLFALDRVVPNSGFLHIEGNSDAHTKALLTGFSVNVIVEDGNLMLGTWQGIYFCEFDGPRRRRVYVKVITG